MAAKEYAFTERGVAVDAAVAADLAPVAYCRIVAGAAEQPERYKASDPRVTGDAAERWQDDPLAKLYVAADDGFGMDEIGEAGSFFEQRGIVLSLFARLADCADEEILRSRLIGGGSTYYGDRIAFAIERVTAIVEEAFYLPRCPSGDRIFDPSVDLAAKLPGADYDQFVGHFSVGWRRS